VAAHSRFMSDDYVRGRDVGRAANDSRFADHPHSPPEVVLSAEPISEPPAPPEAAEIEPQRVESEVVHETGGNPQNLARLTSEFLQKRDALKAAKKAQTRFEKIENLIAAGVGGAGRYFKESAGAFVALLPTLLPSNSSRKTLKKNPDQLSNEKIVELARELTWSTRLSLGGAPLGRALSPVLGGAAGSIIGASTVLDLPVIGIVGGPALGALVGVAASVGFAIAMTVGRSKNLAAVDSIRDLPQYQDSEELRDEVMKAIANAAAPVAPHSAEDLEAVIADRKSARDGLRPSVKPAIAAEQWRFPQWVRRALRQRDRVEVTEIVERQMNLSRQAEALSPGHPTSAPYGVARGRVRPARPTDRPSETPDEDPVDGK